jgi:hypothetical protein
MMIAWPVHRRVDHFLGSAVHGFQTLGKREHAARGGLTFGEVPQRIFGDDYRTVDNQAEIQRAEAHEVGADAPLQHAGCRHQHGHGDDKRGYQRRPEVAEQHEQHEDHQESAFTEVGGDGLHRGVHELGAVEHGFEFNAGRQGAAHLVDFGINGGRDGAAIAANQHERCADDHLVAVLAGAAGPNFTADRHLGNVADTYRHRTSCADNNIANVLEIFEPSTGAHGNPFTVALDDAGATADVIGFNRASDVAEGQAQGDQLRGIRLNLVLLDVAADGIDAGHAHDALDLRPDHPILHGAQIRGALDFGRQSLAFRCDVNASIGFGRRKPDRPHVDFAEAG